MRIATPIVTANSWKRRPTMPPMKRTGMKTAASEIVIEMIVKPISFEPRNAASSGFSPFSMWRTMFSSMTMASSTTNPTESVRAISERLLRLKPSRYITANVPTIESGKARLGMTVAERFRRKRKMTMTTRASVRTSVKRTSSTDSRIAIERSNRTRRVAAAGSCFWKEGKSSRIRSTIWTVFVPGCFWMASVSVRAEPPAVTFQAACLSFSTLSMDRPRSRMRTGAPLR
jgi:hypothetical protein